MLNTTDRVSNRRIRGLFGYVRAGVLPIHLLRSDLVTYVSGAIWLDRLCPDGLAPTSGIEGLGPSADRNLLDTVGKPADNTRL